MSVASRDDVGLIRAAVETAGAGLPRGPRWSHVAKSFKVGSTAAARLCGACGLDPDEDVGATEWALVDRMLGAEALDEDRWRELFDDEPPPEDER